MRRYSMHRRGLIFILGWSIVMLFGSLLNVPAAQAYEHDLQHAITPQQVPDEQTSGVTINGFVPAPPPPPVLDGVQLQGSWEGPYTYRNLNSGMCLEVGNQATHNLAPANQWACTAGWTQQMWYMEAAKQFS
jgi:hypothetical protein